MTLHVMLCVTLSNAVCAAACAAVCDAAMQIIEDIKIIIGNLVQICIQIFQNNVL